MRIGMVCPYSFDEPGGVQVHALELCEKLRSRGHEVSLIGPGTQETIQRLALPEYVTLADNQFSVNYNGSVARLSFGRKTIKHIRQWIAEGDFDVVHIHEPNSPSYSLLTLREVIGPVVATYHASAEQSRLLKLVLPILRPYLERIHAGVAVSEQARKWHVEMLGGDPVLIPNGVETDNYRNAHSLDLGTKADKTLMFLGRFNEPRKGLTVLLDAMPAVLERYPDTRMLIAGGGDQEKLIQMLLERGLSFTVGKDSTEPANIVILGRVTEEEKAQALQTSDIYVAPNTGGESFGIVLVEAMSAGAAVVASDIPAFEAVLDEGNAGALFRNEDSNDLADQIVELFNDSDKLSALAQRGYEHSQKYDWETVATDIENVYEAVRVSGKKVRLR